MRRRLSWPIVLLVLSGCGAPPPLQPPEVLPLVEAAPVAITLRYAEDLRNHHCTGDKGYIAYSWSFALGPPSIEMFDPIFESLFVEVGDGSGAGAGDKRDVVELALTAFTGCQASWPIIGTSVVEIAYEAVVRSPEGAELTRWSGRGRAGPGDDLGDPSLTGDPEASHLNALTSIAMRKAVADFVVAFETDPAVRAWVTR